VLHERLGHYRQALACYTRGRPPRHECKPGCLVRTLRVGSGVGRHLFRQGRYLDCTRFAKESGPGCDTGRARSGLATRSNLEHMMSVYLGQPEERSRDAGRFAIFEEIGDSSGGATYLTISASVRTTGGSGLRSLEHYEASREARVRSGDVVGAATEENNIAEILSDQGDLAGARHFSSLR